MLSLSKAKQHKKPCGSNPPPLGKAFLSYVPMHVTMTFDIRHSDRLGWNNRTPYGSSTDVVHPRRSPYLRTQT